MSIAGVPSRTLNLILVLLLVLVAFGGGIIFVVAMNEPPAAAPKQSAADRASEVAKSIQNGETVIPEGEAHGWSSVSEADRAAMVAFVAKENPTVPSDEILKDLRLVCDYHQDVLYLQRAGYETGYAINLVSATFEDCNT
jgi:hypothetical protein